MVDGPAVWPDDAIRSSQECLPVAQQGATLIFTLSQCWLKQTQKSPNNRAPFGGKIVVKNLKNHPIWSHWVGRWSIVSRFRKSLKIGLLKRLSRAPAAIVVVVWIGLSRDLSLSMKFKSLFIEDFSLWQSLFYFIFSAVFVLKLTPLTLSLSLSLSLSSSGTSPTSSKSRLWH